MTALSRYAHFLLSYHVITKTRGATGVMRQMWIKFVYRRRAKDSELSYHAYEQMSLQLISCFPCILANDLFATTDCVGQSLVLTVESPKRGGYFYDTSKTKGDSDFILMPFSLKRLPFCRLHHYHPLCPQIVNNKIYNGMHVFTAINTLASFYKGVQLNPAPALSVSKVSRAHKEKV